MRKLMLILIVLCAGQMAKAQSDNGTIMLLKPDTIGGMPLMKALQQRHSSRNFVNRDLSLQQLSNLLWAANGVNRIGENKRTAPSSMNKQEIDLYVFTSGGVYLYDGMKQQLVVIKKGDFRASAGTQSYVKDASINLVFVANFERIHAKNNENERFTAGIDCSFIAENIYLYCASEGLGCVVRASIDAVKVHDLLNLNNDQLVLLAQSAGYVM